ncbi:type II secretion system F family protein [uncultured Photobacterium sp.]|uniref:type II secretion system F family protein n=1 Tax=uncultured Photobacterium sp. TaxID=173973 RepID=UPI002619C511|nr:type II secretion system F family protein [uncultured Photobacterium sp.]
MDYIITLINSIVENETYSKWLFLGLAFLSAAALTISAEILFSNLFNPLKKQLNIISSNNKRPNDDEAKQQFDKTLESIEKYVTPHSIKEKHNTRQLLMHAGYEKESALTSFYAIKIILVIFALFGSLIVTRFFPELSSQKVIIYTVIAMGVATFLPNFVINRMAENRIKALKNAFPDALDLLVVSSEAGLGFLAALNRVAVEINSVSPSLSHELQLIGQKVRVGIPMPIALNQFVERTGLIELQGLISIISQSVKLGSSMGETLREYAEEFRDRRMQKAEEEAAKIGTKMIFPLVTCIWPGFFAVAVGPAIIKVLDMFAGK